MILVFSPEAADCAEHLEDGFGAAEEREPGPTPNHAANGLRGQPHVGVVFAEVPVQLVAARCEFVYGNSENDGLEGRYFWHGRHGSVGGFLRYENRVVSTEYLDDFLRHGTTTHALPILKDSAAARSGVCS